MSSWTRQPGRQYRVIERHRDIFFTTPYSFIWARAHINEKGRVENGVGYVKKNLLNGLELSEFSAINPAARLWLDTIANVRIHGETHQRPADLFAAEQAHLKPLNPVPYDVARIVTVRASKQFRVALDTNHYSVPAQYASERVTLKAYPERVCIYHDNLLIARHARSYDRRQDIEDPEHPKALLAQRRNACEQRLMLRFLSLGAHAQAYYVGLEQRRTNARQHMRKIVALSEIYGIEAVARALQDGLSFHAFSCEYIANILEMKARDMPEPRRAAPDPPSGFAGHRTRATGSLTLRTGAAP